MLKVYLTGQWGYHKIGKVDIINVKLQAALSATLQEKMRDKHANYIHSSSERTGKTGMARDRDTIIW